MEHWQLNCDSMSSKVYHLGPLENWNTEKERWFLKRFLKKGEQLIVFHLHCQPGHIDKGRPLCSVLQSRCTALSVLSLKQASHFSFLCFPKLWCSYYQRNSIIIIQISTEQSSWNSWHRTLTTFKPIESWHRKKWRYSEPIGSDIKEDINNE